MLLQPPVMVTQVKKRTNQLNNNNRNTNKQRNVYDVDEVSEKGERVYVLVCARVCDV